VGPYSAIGEAYTALGEWMAMNGYDYEVCYEFYLNDPEETAPEQLETEIVFPIK
jgi:AraC family transcriptional regulator